MNHREDLEAVWSHNILVELPDGQVIRRHPDQLKLNMSDS